MVKMCTKMFSVRKRYPKWKHLKTQQMKCSVNAENVFYNAWSTRKVGVDSESCGGKEAYALGSVMLFNGPTTGESGDYEQIWTLTLSNVQCSCYSPMLFASCEQKVLQNAHSCFCV